MLKKHTLYKITAISLFFLLIFSTKTLHSMIQMSFPGDTIALDESKQFPLVLESNDPNGLGPWDLWIFYDPNILSYVDMSQTALTESHTYLMDYENPNQPGKIKVIGIPELTGNYEVIPLKGTGPFIYLTFTTKRNYPMYDYKSNITATFINDPYNSLRNTQFVPGVIEVAPNLQITNFSPAEGEIDKDIAIQIQGNGFNADAIPVIGEICPLDIIFQDGMIMATIPANSLPQGLFFDILVTNPNGDFGILKDGISIKNSYHQGINLFVYPTVPPPDYDNSYGLLSYLCEGGNGEIDCLRGLDPNSLTWQHTYWEDGNAQGPDFRINYFRSNLLYVGCSTCFSRAFPGHWQDIGVSQQIMQIRSGIISGPNLIGIHIPLNGGMDAHSFTEEISPDTGKWTCLSRINPQTGRWESILPFFNRMNGPGFSIRGSRGFVLYAE